MEKSILVSGLNYKNSSIEERETFSAKFEEANDLISKNLLKKGVSEAIFISTCNRTEIVTSVNESQSLLLHNNIHRDFFTSLIGSSTKRDLSQFLYQYDGRGAINHVFRVASGLDSMILGEPQILGQLKKSYEDALKAGNIKSMLSRLFNKAFHTAKIVRSKTDIGKNPLSFCFASKVIAERIFEDLTSRSVLIVGSGEIATLAAKHFSKADVKQIYVVSRSFDNAVKLAKEVEGVPVPLSKLDNFVSSVDILIGAVNLDSSDDYVITKDNAQAFLNKRGTDPFLMVDLAVPRNIDPKIDELRNVYLYNIDSLKNIIDANLDARRVEAIRAQKLVDEEVDKFCTWMEYQSLNPLIKSLVFQHQQIAKMEVEKTIKHLESMGITSKNITEIESALNRMSSSIVSKLQHHPIEYIKENCLNSNESSEIIEDVFNIKNYLKNN